MPEHETEAGVRLRVAELERQLAGVREELNAWHQEFTVRLDDSGHRCYQMDALEVGKMVQDAEAETRMAKQDLAEAQGLLRRFHAAGLLSYESGKTNAVGDVWRDVDRFLPKEGKCMYRGTKNVLEVYEPEADGRYTFATLHEPSGEREADDWLAENAHLKARVEDAEEVRRASVNEVLREKEAVEEQLRGYKALAERRREALTDVLEKRGCPRCSGPNYDGQHMDDCPYRAAIDCTPEEAKS